jgi:ribosomal protein L31
MKEKIHPKFYSDAKVTCSCGNVFTIGSTKQKAGYQARFFIPLPD